jgi:hypothetical protein
MSRFALRVGTHVKVIETEIPLLKTTHPHAGKRGVITEVLGVLVKIGSPRAMVRLDLDQKPAGHFICVSLAFLEVIQ